MKDYVKGAKQNPNILEKTLKLPNINKSNMPNNMGLQSNENHLFKQPRQIKKNTFLQLTTDHNKGNKHIHLTAAKKDIQPLYFKHGSQ